MGHGFGRRMLDGVLTSSANEVGFGSGGLRCAAWLYRPQGGSGAGRQHPCVVMAPGMTGVRAQRLDAFAERFAAAGLGVLLFDHRHFGDSEGEPRQLLSIRRQLADWRAAVAYARALPGFDPERIALWGSSLSGGHVLVSAARDRRLAAVVAQLPYVDPLANMQIFGVGHSLRLAWAGVKDLAGALQGHSLRLIPAAGPPRSGAFLDAPDAERGFELITPPGSGWRNEIAARFALEAALYRPASFAARVGCPLLVCVGEDDPIAPARAALAAAARAPRSEVRSYPVNHFEIFLGAAFERAVADQTEFLTRHLLG